MKIYKYQLEFLVGEQIIRMAKGSTILTIQMQNEHPCIWATVPEPAFGKSGEDEFRTFITIGTGIRFEENPKDIYIGTYQKNFLDGSNFVGHVFERTE